MKTFKILILLWTISAAATVSISRDLQEVEPLLVEETWTESFSSGTVSSWFSYPLFEDTAFDFTLVPGSYRPQNHLQGFVESGNYFYPVDLAPPHGEDGFYLLRTHRPNSAGRQEIGVAYKKQMWASETSMLEFDYWLRYPVDAAGDLRVELAGKDGRRYRSKITAPEQVEWQRAELELSEFEADDGVRFDMDAGLDAVAVVLELDRGNPGEYVYVAVDNIHLEGRRRAGFELLSPEANQFEHWNLQFARQHVRPGEDLSIEVRSETDLSGVTARFLDPDGEPLGRSVSLTNSRGNRWVSQQPLRLPQQALGPLTLVVEGRDPQDRFARSEVRVWNLGEPDERRPRVLFTEEGREQMREKIESHDRFSEIWDQIVRRAALAREQPFPKEVTFQEFNADFLMPTLGDWFEVMRRARTEQIMDNALVWYMDGDEDARDFAIESMLRMAGWEQWIHPWFTGQGRASYYPLGHAVMSNGIAYDLLYEELNEEQRRTIRRGVMENGIIPTWQEYFEDNRIPNNTSNWISMAAGGSLVGLMAFYDELDRNTYGEPWFSGLAEKVLELSRQTMLPDGGYGEGIGYQYVTLSHVQDVMAVLETMFGVRNGLLDVLGYENGYLFWLYISTDGTHDALTMGDSNPQRSSLDYWSWIARKSDDPVLKWFYAQRPGRNWPALLWDEPDAEEQGEAPDGHLTDSRIFPDKGNVVFRTGWEDEDAVFVYRAGPNFNHTHFDQGNFRFYALGEELITESGRASYYSDPYYWSHFIQASGHNTLLVDNFPESQRAGDFDNEVTAFDDYARITDALVTGAGGFVVSDLAPVYYAGLDTLTRRIWFVDPGYVILEDHIVSSGEAHLYQSQFYPPDLNALHILNNRQAEIRKGDAEMRIQVLSPESPRLDVRQYPFANRQLTSEAPLHPRGALQVTHEDPAVSQLFRVVLAPEKEGAGMPDGIREVESGGYEGVELTFDDGRMDWILFAGESDSLHIPEAGIHTDARSLFVSRDDSGNLRALTVEGASKFSYGDQFSFSSEQAVHAGLVIGEDGTDRVSLSGSMDTDGEIRVRFTTDSGGRVSVEEPDRGQSRLNSSRSRRDGTTASVILSGGPIDIRIQ